MSHDLWYNYWGQVNLLRQDSHNPYSPRVHEGRGSELWYLISEDKNLYTDIVEPVGHRAKEHNEKFIGERSKLSNRLTKVLIDGYCDKSGAIDWLKLVRPNSGNYDLDKFLPESR